MAPKTLQAVLGALEELCSAITRAWSHGGWAGEGFSRSCPAVSRDISWSREDEGLGKGDLLSVRCPGQCWCWIVC